MISFPPAPVWQEIVGLALREDLGRRGDLTSRALFPADQRTVADFVARKPGIVSGTGLIAYIMNSCNGNVVTSIDVKDGEAVKAGQPIARVEGPTIAVLEAERTALNFLSHLSGIATLTRSYVAAVAGTKAKIVCTRKTIPGLRALEKYAVACGGGSNHRFGLDDAVMIKDNHIAAAGDIGRAVERVRASVGHMVKIEVEVETDQQLDAALAHNVDVILLDNWPVATLAAAIKKVNGRAITEASGGITLETVRAVADCGVDLISVGALTHSAPVLDIGLDIA